MKIIALQDYSDNYIAFRQGEILNLPNSIAERLIAKRVCGTGFPDDVNVTPSSTTGTQIASIAINGQATKLYAPAGGSIFIVGQDNITGALNKTWKEIWDAMSSGSMVVIRSVYEDTSIGDSLVSAVYNDGNEYVIDCFAPADNSDHVIFKTDSQNGYGIPEWDSTYANLLKIVSDDGETANKNANEIITDIDNGRYPVFFNLSISGCVAPFAMVEWGQSEEYNKVIFSTSDATQFSIDANGNVNDYP